jgi:Family of unknown function (DUF6152)
MRRQLIALATGAVFQAVTGASALAHHSFAMFDASKKVTLSGTVKEFQWINPHAWVFVMVHGHDGQLEQWAIEMGGPGQMARQGFSSHTLAPGMNVEVTIHPLRDGANGGQFMALTLPDGTQLGNPDRSLRPAEGTQL